MSVAKIFKVLIIVVACVIIGALVLNVLLPNTTKSLVNAVENQVYNATGLSFDFNGDGNGITGGRDHTGDEILPGDDFLQARDASVRRAVP